MLLHRPLALSAPAAISFRLQLGREAVRVVQRPQRTTTILRESHHFNPREERHARDGLCGAEHSAGISTAIHAVPSLIHPVGFGEGWSPFVGLKQVDSGLILKRWTRQPSQHRVPPYKRPMLSRCTSITFSLSASFLVVCFLLWSHEKVTCGLCP